MQLSEEARANLAALQQTHTQAQQALAQALNATFLALGLDPNTTQINIATGEIQGATAAKEVTSGSADTSESTGTTES